MKTLLSLICIVSTLNCAKADWAEFSPEGGAFTILMPGPVKQNTSQDGTILGTINENLATSRFESGTCSVEYQDLPGVAVMLGGKSTIFNDAKNGLLKNAGATEESWTDTEVDGNPAKMLVYSNGQALFVLVGNRFYVMDASGLPADDASTLPTGGFRKSVPRRERANDWIKPIPPFSRASFSASVAQAGTTDRASGKSPRQ